MFSNSKLNVHRSDGFNFAVCETKVVSNQQRQEKSIGKESAPMHVSIEKNLTSTGEKDSYSSFLTTENVFHFNSTLQQ